MTHPKEISKAPESDVIFSICTLVTKQLDYDAMLASFEKAGFVEPESEYLYIDNTKSNQLDAYQGLNRLIACSKGQYIILCHQDILLNHDDKSVLLQRIKELDQRDETWAVLGNSGAAGNLAERYVRISDPYGDDRKIGHFPCLVNSLDENFILIKKSACMGFSCDLSGFHFYGTDICMIANIRGYHCYVIDFHLTHKSKGTRSDDFYACQKRFLNKYCKAFLGRFVRTPCASFYFSGVAWKNKIFNHPLVMRKIKRLFKWKILS